ELDGHVRSLTSLRDGVRLVGIEAELAEDVPKAFARKTAVSRERVESGDDDGFGVVLEEPAQRRARVAAAESIRAAVRVGPRDPTLDHARHRAHVVGRRDEAAFDPLARVPQMAALRILAGVEHVPALGHLGVDAQALPARDAPHIRGDAVAL